MLIISFLLTLNIVMVEAGSPPLKVEFEIFGEGEVKWTNEVVHSGSYSLKLLLPEYASKSSWAFAKVSYGRPLRTLDEFSFYVKYVNARPRFAIYLDKDGDGRVDSLLLSDYLDFGSGEWTIGTGGLRWGWTEASYPPWKYGETWQPYSYWKKLYGDAVVPYVSIVLEYWAVGVEGLGEPLYADVIIINRVSYDLEPSRVENFDDEINSYILAEANKWIGKIGNQCKEWVRRVVWDASGKSIYDSSTGQVWYWPKRRLPPTQPSGDRWQETPWTIVIARGKGASLCDYSSTIKPGHIIQFTHTALKETTPHTVIVLQATSSGFLVIDSNWLLDGIVRSHWISREWMVQYIEDWTVYQIR